MRVESISALSSVEEIRDGSAYRFPDTPPFVQTNLFLKIARLDRLYVKLPSERGMEDYRKFVRLGQTGSEDVRTLEVPERFESLNQTLHSLPDLQPLTAVGSELAHYAVVHKLQHNRLTAQSAVKIPRARFGALQQKGRAFLRTYQPAMFQERICGTTLWEMFDFEALAVRPQWQPFVPFLSARLAELMNSALLHHVDWNIQNFVFNEPEGNLYYVDLKPTTFVARHSNEHNLEGIRRYFAV